MRQETFGRLEAHVTGGHDREGGGEGPVVVLMHGFGAPGSDLVGLWRALSVPRDIRFVFPEGPLSLGASMVGESRAWWMLDMERVQRAQLTGETLDRSEDVPEGLPPARQAVIELLDAVQERLGVRSDQVVLGGFSQGAMLALDVALRDARPLAGLVQLSSTLIARSEWEPRMASRAGLPVLQSHGRRDPLLAFDAAESLRDLLEQAGLEVTWVPFQGAHEIPLPVVDALGRFLARRFDSREA